MVADAETHPGLRRRAVGVREQHGPREEEEETRRPRRRETRVRHATLKVSHIYCLVSCLVALLAIVTSPTPGAPAVSRSGALFEKDDWSVENVAKAAIVAVKKEKEQTAPPTKFFFKSIQELLSPKEEAQLTTEKNGKPGPAWLRWLIHLHKDAANAQPSKSARPLSSMVAGYIKTLVDPSILHPSASTPTDIIDKILTSTPRLLAIANLLLAITFLLHTAVADWFLGGFYHHDWAGRERLGGFLVFKLLLISAVVAPDTLDLLILLSWYTLLSFLRSLAHLAAATTSHTTQSGQPPRPGVVRLLAVVLLCDFLAAAVCVALFHGAGWGMVILLTCDCALLALDVVCHILRHISQVLEEAHGTAIAAVEERQLQLHQRRQLLQRPEDAENGDQDPRALLEESRVLDRKMEILELSHSRRLAILDRTVFILQLFAHALTLGHFVHIWSLHGVHFTLIDGVLALHLHSALSSASKKIAERRNLHRIARDLDGMFEDASALDLRKASAAGDVCCICLGTMTTGNVKKVGCGHLYHTHCLREVVERARSIEAARCPLCRASVLDGRHVSEQTNRPATGNAEVREEAPPRAPPQEGAGAPPAPNNAGERALFRFSTEGVFPAWIPLPAFSFEVVRRPPMTVEPLPEANRNNTNNNDNNGNRDNNAGQQPQQQQQQQQQPQPSMLRRFLVLAGAIPMSPEEEARAIEQLVDMFPQYHRSDLLRELRMRGSAEAVVDAVLLGVFSGVRRGADGEDPR